MLPVSEKPVRVTQDTALSRYRCRQDSEVAQESLGKTWLTACPAWELSQQQHTFGLSRALEHSTTDWKGVTGGVDCLWTQVQEI